MSLHIRWHAKSAVANMIIHMVWKQTYSHWLVNSYGVGKAVVTDGKGKTSLSQFVSIGSGKRSSRRRDLCFSSAHCSLGISVVLVRPCPLQKCFLAIGMVISMSLSQRGSRQYIYIYTHRYTYQYIEYTHICI